MCVLLSLPIIRASIRRGSQHYSEGPCPQGRPGRLGPHKEYKAYEVCCSGRNQMHGPMEVRKRDEAWRPAYPG